MTTYTCLSAFRNASKYEITLDEYLNSFQSIKFAIPEPIESVFAECKNAVDSIGAKIVKLDDQKGEIDVSTGLSLNSFGHRICIRVLNVEDGNTEVQIQSHAKGKWGKMDSGKGRNNVEAIKEQLISTLS